MMHTFKSNLDIVGRVYHQPSVEEIHDETMLFSASLAFARNCGGPLTQRVLDSLTTIPHPSPGRYIVIDTRCHMLMKGMYPAIPGWHGDGFPRSDKYAQPDLEAYSPTVKHYTCVLSTNAEGVSRTEFFTESDGMEIDINPEAVWKSVDKTITGFQTLFPRMYVTYSRRRQNDGEIFCFDQNTLHRVHPCSEPGWRFFFRLSYYHRPPRNEIRRQVQVYTTAGGGW